MVNKKLLVISYYFHPDLSAGSFRMKSLIDSFNNNSSNSIDIEVITSIPNRYNSYVHEKIDDNYLSNIKIKRIQTPIHNNKFSSQIFSYIIFSLKTFFYVRKKKYNAIFVTSSRLMSAFLGAIIANYKNIPLYLDIRDLLLDTINDIFKSSSFFLYPIINLIEKYTFSSAKRISIVSGGFQNYISKKYPHKIIKIFTNGIDKEFMNLEKIKVSRTGNVRKKILYAGNIGEGQGLDKIIPELAKKIEKKAEFIIIGDGGMLNVLKNEVAKKNCSNITFLKPMHRNKLIEHYIKADIFFIHLNDYNAYKKVLPSKIFEYGSFGKPIFGGLGGFARSFVNDELPFSYIFNPCNVEEAVVLFDKISYKKTFFNKFNIKFNRTKISENLRDDIYDFIK